MRRGPLLVLTSADHRSTTVGKRAARILLECFLVGYRFEKGMASHAENKRYWVGSFVPFGLG